MTHRVKIGTKGVGNKTGYWSIDLDEVSLVDVLKLDRVVDGVRIYLRGFADPVYITENAAKEFEKIYMEYANHVAESEEAEPSLIQIVSKN